MKKWTMIGAVLVAAGSFAAVGCGDTDCTTAYYADKVTLTVEDDAGQPIDSFTGTVSVGETDFTVDCPGSSGDEPAEGNYQCQNGVLELYATPPSQITVDLAATNDPSRAFSGTLDLNVDESEPNGEGCGFHRTADETLTLTAPETGGGGS